MIFVYLQLYVLLLVEIGRQEREHVVRSAEEVVGLSVFRHLSLAAEAGIHRLCTGREGR